MNLNVFLILVIIDNSHTVFTCMPFSIQDIHFITLCIAWESNPRLLVHEKKILINILIIICTQTRPSPVHLFTDDNQTKLHWKNVYYLQ